MANMSKGIKDGGTQGCCKTQERGHPQQQQASQDWQRTRHDAGGTVCRGRAGAPDRGARRADGHSSGEGADPARWAQGEGVREWVV